MLAVDHHCARRRCGAGRHVGLESECLDAHVLDELTGEELARLRLQEDLEQLGARYALFDEQQMHVAVVARGLGRRQEVGRNERQVDDEHEHEVVLDLHPLAAAQRLVQRLGQVLERILVALVD